MFNLGFTEILLLFVIGLLVLGPKQLPQVARVLGKMAGELKRAMNEFSSEIDKTSKGFQAESKKIQSEVESSLKIPEDSNKEENGKS
tara:strand:- start:1319 stop:1579 length:261 start_codon:yes stop_codon:yes gene_type:complete